MPAKVERDPQIREVAYIRLSNRPVARTVEKLVAIDLDANGDIIGIDLYDQCTDQIRAGSHRP